MAYSKVETVPLRPEAMLLLCCARTHIDTEKAEQIRQLLQEDIDWDYLIRVALQHGMMPLLSWHLSAICSEAVPTATLHQLRSHFHTNAQHNLFLTGELLKLLNLLEGQGISAVPFKGPILATIVYGNLALRQFGDLDILVHEKDFVKTKGLLIAQGYQPWRQLTGAQEIRHLQSEHAYTFIRADGKVHVDLHWRFAQRRIAFALDPERLWERLERIPLAGRSVPTLPPEETLLILCMHGAKHSWGRLAWVCDVAELVRTHKEIKYEWVIEQVGRLHDRRRLILGLFLAQEFLGARLPEQVSHVMKTDPQVQSLALRVRVFLFSEEHSLLEAGKKITFFFRTKERLRDRVPYLFYHLRKMTVPTAKDFALLPLPPLLFFLYGVSRPIRLIAAYGWLSLKRLVIRDVPKNLPNK